MAMTPAPTPEAPEAPPAPAKHHMPCCPSPETGCPGNGCAAPVAVLQVVGAWIPESAAFAVPVVPLVQLVSVARAPEPPPPRI
jgi:hypothetical protein